MAMLPFEPESLESMQARFPKALERIWVVPSNGDMPDRPGMHREHLFDFESGLRLLISIDRLDKANTIIHISASWEYFTPVTFTVASEQVNEAYKSLGGKGHLKLIGVSQFGVPHWTVKIGEGE